MGCLRSLGCLVLIVILAACAWIFRASWLPLLHRGPAQPASGATPAVVWQPLTPEGGARAKETVQKLGTRSGPVFANLEPGDLSAYIFQELSRQLPPSAEHIEAAVIGDELHIRADVELSDFGDTDALGPLAGVLGGRAPVQFGGTLDIVRSGLAEYQVRSLRVRDLSIPKPMIPRLLRKIEHGSRPAGVADDGLPFAAPPYLADVRIHNGKITLYKAVR
jgi:hypothetical protein